jgi:hypothetical protein
MCGEAMSSWTGNGAATRVHSPDFDEDFFALPQKIQRQIEKKLDEMGLAAGGLSALSFDEFDRMPVSRR